MPSNRVYPFGQPENDGERRVIRFLDEYLPSIYRIYHNLERQSGGQTYEWDIVVLAPHALFCLEVKDWPGNIKGNDREWLLQNGAVRKNPYPLIGKKARVLKSQLVSQDAFLRGVWVEPLIVIADDKVALDLKGDCAQHTLSLKNLIAYLTNASGGQWAGSDHRSRFSDIEKILTRDFGPTTPVRQIAQFRLIEPITASDLFTEWRAENRYAVKSSTVRLKIYSTDPYLPTAQRDEQLRLIRRDFEATARLGSHPHILAARDFFPDEGGTYILVLDDIPGRSLEAELLAGHTFTFEQKLRLIEDIAEGLDHAHTHKVIHRDVRPLNIWPSPTGALLLNFDCARLGNGNTVSGMIRDGLDIRYLAPEVQASPSGATAASDVYSLGVVLYEFLTGSLPTIEGKHQSLLAFDALIDPALEELVDEMLALEPDTRPSAIEVRNRLSELRDQRRAGTKATDPYELTKTEESAVDFPVGAQIDGQYLVREVLGEGSFGKVYRVYSAVTDFEYAMKVFRDPGLGLEDAQNEFLALAKLQHPRIVRVWHAAKLSRGAYYLLTEYVSGKPLHKYMELSKPAPTEALHFTMDLLDAIKYLHGHGYVHRDIKPSNVLISPDGAWLIDFNVATKATGSTATKAGTPLYSPPDIANCGDSPSRDLFATGVVLYEMLLGVHPYGGSPRAGSVPKDPKEVEPRLTDQMSDVLKHAVAPNAGERYKTAEEFLTDLRSIEEPLMPPPPRYGLVEGIPVTQEELTRRNYNPYLHRFQTLYSQNRLDNSGTRGYDEISKATYVRSLLDKRLVPDIIAGRFSLVIITGNAGDGKTALLQRLEKQLADGYEGQPGINITHLQSGNGANFIINGREYRTNYDGSQDEIGLQNDDVLAEFLAPFAGNTQDVAISHGHLTRLIAINEGKLRDFLGRRKSKFPWLADAVEKYLDQSQPLPEGFLLVNLNERSVVAGEISVLDQQITALCDPVFWQSCQQCQYVSRCPVRFNVDSINHPDLGPRIRRRLRRLFEVVHLRGRLHLTMRGIRSALAYILFGDGDCSTIASWLDISDPESTHDEELLQHFYYNAVASGNQMSTNKDLDTEERDQLLRLMCEVNVGLGANPADDRELHYAGVDNSPLLPKVGNRADYDRDLFKSMIERANAETDLVLRMDLHMRLHVGLRRKAFFERPDDGWKAMLPYSMLSLMLEASRGDDEAIKSITTIIIRGINHGEGLGDVNDILVLRLARGVPGQVHSFRQFAAKDFVLRPMESITPSGYIEYSPATLDFVFRPGLNGEKRPTLRVGLDLLELLSRMGRGYAPSTAEWRGPLVNLQVFRTLLSHESYDHLILVDALQDQRFRISKQGGEMRLEEEVL